MRLADVVTDSRGADPRARSAGQGSAEQTPDTNAVPFGDVLSDMGAASTPAISPANGDDASLVQNPVTAKPGETESTMKISLPQVTGAPKYAGSARPTDMKGTGSDTVDELISRLSRGASVAPSETPASKGAAKSSQVDDPDERGRTPSDKPKKAAAPDDIVAMLLSGPAGTVPPNPALAAPSSTDKAETVTSPITSKASQTPDASAVKEDRLEAQTDQKPLPNTTSPVQDGPQAITDLSVSTHLAPAASSPLKGNNVGDPQNISSAPVQKSAGRLAVDALPDNTSKSPRAEPISPQAAGASNSATLAVSAGVASAKTSPEPRPSRASGDPRSSTETAPEDRSEPSNSGALRESDVMAVPVEGASSNGEEAAGRQRDPRPIEPTMARTAPIGGGIVLDSLHPASVSTTVSKVVAAVEQLAQQANASTAVPSSSIAPARTLNLKMNQADLGPVAIRMHLSGRDLDLQLTVTDQGTLADLSRDRGALVSALGSHHYQVHSLVIQDGVGPPASGGNHVGSGDAGSGTRPDAQETGDRNGGGRNDQQKTPRGDNRSNQTGPRHAGDGHRGGSLFV